MCESIAPKTHKNKKKQNKKTNPTTTKLTSARVSTRMRIRLLDRSIGHDGTNATLKMSASRGRSNTHVDSTLEQLEFMGALCLALLLLLLESRLLCNSLLQDANDLWEDVRGRRGGPNQIEMFVLVRTVDECVAGHLVEQPLHVADAVRAAVKEGHRALDLLHGVWVWCGSAIGGLGEVLVFVIHLELAHCDHLEPVHNRLYARVAKEVRKEQVFALLGAKVGHAPAEQQPAACINKRCERVASKQVSPKDDRRHACLGAENEKDRVWREANKAANDALLEALGEEGFWGWGKRGFFLGGGRERARDRDG